MDIRRLIIFVFLPLGVYGGTTYEVRLNQREKNPSSVFCTNDLVFVQGFRMEERLLARQIWEVWGIKTETTWRLHWQTEKDALYDHDWKPGQRDFRAFPEEMFVEWMHDFRYFVTVGKKKWDMSEGFFYKPMLLWADYDGYRRYGEGFYMVKGEVRLGDVKLSGYVVPSRFGEEKSTNEWYDCFQNATTNWLGGGAFSCLIGGVMLKGLSLWEWTKEGKFPVSKYAISSAWSWERWIFYTEASYKNGVGLKVPGFDGREETNVPFPGITNITPGKYEFSEREGSFSRMFWDVLVGVRAELPWDVTLRCEVLYRERSWNDEERKAYWDGVRYAESRYKNELYFVVPETYLLLAAGHLSFDTYAPWLVSLGLTKTIGDHWEVSQDVTTELSTYSWRWQGGITWKSLSLWEVGFSVSVVGGERYTLFGEMVEKIHWQLSLSSSL